MKSVMPFFFYFFFPFENKIKTKWSKNTQGRDIIARQGLAPSSCTPSSPLLFHLIYLMVDFYVLLPLVLFQTSMFEALKPANHRCLTFFPPSHTVYPTVRSWYQAFEWTPPYHIMRNSDTAGNYCCETDLDMQMFITILPLDLLMSAQNSQFLILLALFSKPYKV